VTRKRISCLVAYTDGDAGKGPLEAARDGVLAGDARIDGAEEIVGLISEARLEIADTVGNPGKAAEVRHGDVLARSGRSTLGGV